MCDHCDEHRDEREDRDRGGIEIDSGGDIGIPLGGGLTLDSDGDIGISIGGGLTIDSDGDIGFRIGGL